MVEKILIWLLKTWVNRESLKTFGAVRSSQWDSVRKEHLKIQPACAVCGTIKDVQVHHKRPFHLHPELELDSTNLITLCDEKGCHLRFGHLYNFQSFNKDIEQDAHIWKSKIINRP